MRSLKSSAAFLILTNLIIDVTALPKPKTEDQRIPSTAYDLNGTKSLYSPGWTSNCNGTYLNPNRQICSHGVVVDKPALVSAAEPETRRDRRQSVACPSPLPADWDLKDGCEVHHAVSIPPSLFASSRKARRNESSAALKANPAINEGLAGSDDGARPRIHDRPPSIPSNAKRVAEYNNFYNTPFNLPKDSGVPETETSTKTKREAEYNNLHNTPFEFPMGTKPTSETEATITKAKRELEYTKFYNTQFDLPKDSDSESPTHKIKRDAAYNIYHNTPFELPREDTPAASESSTSSTKAKSENRLDERFDSSASGTHQGKHIPQRRSQPYRYEWSAPPKQSKSASSSSPIVSPQTSAQGALESDNIRQPNSSSHKAAITVPQTPAPPPISPFTGDLGRRTAGSSNYWNTPVGPLKDDTQISQGSPSNNENNNRKKRMVQSSQLPELPNTTSSAPSTSAVDTEQAPPSNDHEEATPAFLPTGNIGSRDTGTGNNWNTPVGPLKGEDEVSDGGHPVEAVGPGRRRKIARRDGSGQYSTSV